MFQDLSNKDFQNRLVEMDKQEEVLSVMDNQSVFGEPGATAGGIPIRNFQDINNPNLNMIQIEKQTEMNQ